MKLTSILKTKRSALMASYLSIILLIGCGTSPKDYAETTPEFDLKSFFTGDLKGWGLVKNYQGKVTQRFTVDMNGSWNDNQGILYELFTYSDGSTQERTWYLTKSDNSTSTGTASDVVGTAVGVQNGFAFNWNYDLLFESGGKQIQVHLKDWLYQVDANSVIGQASIHKFGLNVGEVIVFMLKEDSST